MYQSQASMSEDLWNHEPKQSSHVLSESWKVESLPMQQANSTPWPSRQGEKMLASMTAGFHDLHLKLCSVISADKNHSVVVVSLSKSLASDGNHPMTCLRLWTELLRCAHTIKEDGDMLMRTAITRSCKIHSQIAINLWRFLKNKTHRKSMIAGQTAL